MTDPDWLKSVEWRAEARPPDCDDTTPYATHSGVLLIGDARLRVFRLSNGQAVIHADDLNAFFDAF